VRGRKPTPTFLKLITGNPGHRPINRDEPEPEGDLRDPPDWFTPRQRILWDQTIRAAPPGLLRLLDATLLETFIVAKSLHEDSAKKVAEYGAVIRAPGSGVPMRSPFVGIMNQQAQVLGKCIAEMGFSPTSRSRVKITARKKPSPLGKLKAMQID